MNEAYERLQKELSELETKTDKLTKFLQSEKFNELNAENQCLLSTQQCLMTAYANLLKRRLATFEF